MIVPPVQGRRFPDSRRLAGIVVLQPLRRLAGNGSFSIPRGTKTEWEADNKPVGLRHADLRIGPAARTAFLSALSATAVYRCVVATDVCPRSSCTARMSLVAW